MEVFLTRDISDPEYERLRSIPGMTAISHRTGDPNAAIVIEVEAGSRVEAEAVARAAAEIAVAAIDIARVGGADDTMQDRQLMLWVRATRHQLRRWETALAVVLAKDLNHTGTAEGHEIWDVQIHRHLALVAANNVARAIDNATGRYSAMPGDMARELRNQRDLQEHWDEQWPAFYNARSPGPLKRGGAVFAERHPDHSPFDFLGWNSNTGPRLGPGLLLAEIWAHLDLLEAEVLAHSPGLSKYVTELSPSPWAGERATAPSYRWWPMPSDG